MKRIAIAIVLAAALTIGFAGATCAQGFRLAPFKDDLFKYPAIL